MSILRFGRFVRRIATRAAVRECDRRERLQAERNAATKRFMALMDEKIHEAFMRQR